MILPFPAYSCNKASPCLQDLGDTIKYALDNMLIIYQKGTYIENITMEIKTYDY